MVYRLILFLFSTSALAASNVTQTASWVEGKDGEGVPYFDRKIGTSVEAGDEKLSLGMTKTVTPAVESTLYKGAFTPTEEVEVRTLYNHSEGVEETYGVGASMWVHPQVQFSFDLSRTEGTQASGSVLDDQFNTIVLPESRTSIGNTFGVRHLMNPYTVGLYSVSYKERSDAPMIVMGSAEIRHLLPEYEVVISGSIGAGKSIGATKESLEQPARAVEYGGKVGMMLGDAEYGVRYRGYLEEEQENLYGSDLVEASATWQLYGFTTGIACGNYLNNKHFHANIYSLSVSKDF